MKHKHLLLMAFCYLIPAALFVALLYANIESIYPYSLLILLCPLMPFIMMLPRRHRGSMIESKRKT